LADGPAGPSAGLLEAPLSLRVYGEGNWGELREPWRDLLAHSRFDTVFFTWEWQRTWWKHFSAPGGRDSLRDPQLRLVAIEEEGRLVGLAPLYRESFEGPQGATGTRLRLGGGPDVTDYQDVIARHDRESQVAEGLCAYLVGPQAEPWDRLDLHNLVSDSPWLTDVAPALRARGLVVHAGHHCVAPCVDLPDSFDGYLTQLNKHERHELRRKTRRLAERGYQFETAGPDEASAHLAVFAELHRRSPGAKGQFLTAQMEEFFRDIGAQAAERGWLDLHTLELQGRPAASIFAFTYAEAINLYNSATDPAVASLSPGVVAIAECIRSAIAAGIKTYDFLRGDEHYKYQLGGKDRELWRLQVGHSEFTPE
jgi:CelD/BcsL family acetyltransferase involved in cellulose biosynthesis